MKFSKISFKAAVVWFITALSLTQIQAQPVIKLISDTACSPDTVQISITGTRVIGVNSFELLVHFDDSRMRFDSVFYAMNFLDRHFQTDLISSSVVKLTWDSVRALTIGSEAVMFKLQFTALNPGNPAIIWEGTSALRDAEQQLVISEFVDANVLINSKYIRYTLTQIMEGCVKEKKGRYSVSVTYGSPPFIYDWHGGFLNPGVDTIVLGLKGGPNKLTIYDSKWCRFDTTFQVKVKPAPAIRLSTEEAVPYVIVQKPDVQFYSNIDSINLIDNSIPNWQWDFGEPDSSRSVETDPLHTFKTAFTVLEAGTTSYMIKLWAISNDGCDTSVYKEVQIDKPEPEVFNVFTPNGDGQNELFTIHGSKKADLEEWPLSDFYDRMELLVYDRNGRKVYESTDYQNDWDGGGHADGTYFYVLKCYGRFGDETYQGSLMILTGGK